jgi:hypothetical protein
MLSEIFVVLRATMNILLSPCALPCVLCLCQGPALLAYNDACFTEEDWDGILLMYRSIKEKDALKVGRFGLGFKSVFHMTGRRISS